MISFVLSTEKDQYLIVMAHTKFPYKTATLAAVFWAAVVAYGDAAAPFATETVDYTQSKDGKTAYAIVKKPATTVTLACALPDDVVVTVVGESVPLKTKKCAIGNIESVAGGREVYLPPTYANAEVPFALKMRAACPQTFANHR